MAYVRPNFRTKKALREAVSTGRIVRVFQPGGIFPDPRPGTQGVAVEGPHSPDAHTWYAQVDIDADGRVTKVR